MNIRLKVTASIAIACAILGAAEILVEQRVLMPSFVELEHADARTAMKRINYVLDMRLERLAAGAKDWGNWADTYRFVQDRNAAYAAESATDFALRQLKVDAFAVADLAGHLLLVKELPQAGSPPAHLQELSGQLLPQQFPWHLPLSLGQSLKGFVNSDGGPFMFAAAPILDGNGGGPVRGTILMGRRLSADEVEALGSQAQAQLAIESPRSQHDAEQQLSETDSTTRVYRLVRDIYAKPILTVRVDVPRAITERGRSAVTYASAYLIGALLLLLIILVVVLNRVILRPLDRVTRHAIAIGKDTDLTMQLNLSGSDEMSTLALELDRMVARLAESRRQLVDRSFEAGHAEMAKGVLHNLGNAMTPIGVRLANLRDRLRTAPVDDAEQAATELEGPVVDEQRHAELREFTRLAARELAATVRGVTLDVEIMSRQTTAVQSMLAEQRRAARNEHVIEAVRLPELLTQALEIIPDVSRARLSIQADESLRKLGVVHVARTVLRLVLQNIIINAADAVSESARSKGHLCIRAEIVRDGPAEQLRVHCEDDGVGIAAQNLERIFDKGFSTKSRDTNSGIGLHWCANAIGALGGRMWASSEGPGRGATIHVLLPLPARQALVAGAA
ncbi:MAG: HAMP domain-containing protein [Sinobacteraceae bacterium]|nr:HAMP domain-containing protein [Nevskiaceae bacterium]